VTLAGLGANLALASSPGWSCGAALGETRRSTATSSVRLRAVPGERLHFVFQLMPIPGSTGQSCRAGAAAARPRGVREPRAVPRALHPRRVLPAVGPFLAIVRASSRRSRASSSGRRDRLLNAPGGRASRAILAAIVSTASRPARLKRVLTGYRPTGRCTSATGSGTCRTCCGYRRSTSASTSSRTGTCSRPTSTARATSPTTPTSSSRPPRGGIDPERVTLYRQSDVKEVAEMTLLLGMITPLGWLERVPTYKERLRDNAERDIANYGLLGYPVLQTVDSRSSR